jgi:hypothetical protein
MGPSSQRYDQVEPRLIRRANGGWLAVSGPGAPIGIGVEGDTADEARECFRRELAAWTALSDKNESRTE